MKRRVLSFIIMLTMCLNLCPVWALAADEGTDDGLCPHHPAHTDECGYIPGSPGAPCTFVCEVCSINDLTEDEEDQVDLSSGISLQSQAGEANDRTPADSVTPNHTWQLESDEVLTSPYIVSDPVVIDTNGHSIMAPELRSPAIQVTETGQLYFKGKIISPNGTGIEVASGGSLSIDDPDTVIVGSVCGLDVASDAEIHLSAGTFAGIGTTAAAIRIQPKDGESADFAALLEPGYAYFDTDDNPILLADMEQAAEVVVDLCPGHSGKTYTHTSGTTTHTWTCSYCGKVEETEACTFTFDEDGIGNGTCACGNTISIAVDEKDLTGLVYDGTVKPEEVSITVTLTDGSNKKLVKETDDTDDADYKVDYEPRTDAGEITVTVTGITFNGTFTKTYHVEQAEPGIRWDAATCAVDYDGSPVDSASLPHITITINANGEDLHPYLQYFYRKTGDTEFIPGLPTNAGTYEIKATIPESQNYKTAETDPLLTLTINKIPAIATAPAAKTLTYNREAQELVTAGVLAPGAAADGARIEYKLGTDGTYSTDIPTGVGVSSYAVYYRVADTENYSGVSETLVKNPNTTYPSARINHREIKPMVELEYDKTMYTGEIKEPKFTVKDGEYEIPKSEYTFEYSNNRNVGTATLTITNANNGNYKLLEAKATFQITSQPQAALSITRQPDTVTYGDKFTLGTTGGSGSGDVTWKITAGENVAAVDEHSGQVTIVGHGSFTVQATKSGKDPTDANITNYDDATASWTVTAAKKPVTATVTAEDKSYGETYGSGDLKAAEVHAVVEQGVLPGDEITITGLTGTFSDENAGANKTVTVDTANAVIGGTNFEHYAVTYSSATVKATIHKAVVHITTGPDAKNLTYDSTAQELIDDSVLVVDTEGVSVEYALSENGLYATDIPEGTNAGTYTVWYRVQETDNYTGVAPAKVDVTISKKPVEPTIALDQNEFVYDGNAKEPVVTLYEADGTTLIPADQYTVSYSDNVNVGTAATVTVTAKADGNYAFTPDPVTTTFEIKEEQARVLTAPEAAGDPLYFRNSAQKLVTAGTGYGGKMVYTLDKDDENSYSETIPTGTEAKDYTVYYKVAGDDNHSDSEVGHVTVTIAPKTVNSPNLTIELRDDEGKTLVSYTYDGNPKEPTVIVKDGSTVIDADKEYNVIYRDNTDAGRATVEITDKPGGNYTVTGSATFVIVKADIVFAPAPSAADITYDGKAHELLSEGTFEGGTVQYALGSKTSEYSAAIPTATEAGTYNVWYKVTGDKNHNDLPAVKVENVEIKRKPLIAITIGLSPENFAYDGKVKLPEVTVWDEKALLPEEEYTWTCSVESPTNVGTYTITISDKEDGNYDLSKLTPPANEATFTIGQISQDELVIGGKPAATNYGDSFQLTVSGGSGDGGVTWDVDGHATIEDGKVTINDVGEVTITVKKAADTNYLAAQAEWTFTAAPRPVTATVEATNKVFDGKTGTTVTSAGIDTINGDTVNIDPTTITADFDTPTVGTGKTVTLDTSKVKVDGEHAAKYAISYPETATADIRQATTLITENPDGITQLTYSGQPQSLVEAGETNVGFIVYSLDGTNFSPEIPTGTNAGDYTVYYKVDSTADYTGVAVNETPVTVTIAPKSVVPVIEVSESSYLYDGTKKNPTITVKDDETVIDKKQYTVTWAGTKGQTDAEMLTVADTYTATIENVANGNYTFSKTVTVKIVAATQNALEITGTPDHVCYGDTITTLKASGGSGNGTLAWSITAGGANSSIDPATGDLTVKDTGSITVKAERTVPNYETVSATWTFTVEPKPVTAVVTVAPKDYDGTTDIADNDITAAVKTGVMSGDSITIANTGSLHGTYDNANVGTNKTVTLDTSGFTISDTGGKYAVSIPATAQADINPRTLTTVTVTLSDHDLQTDASGAFYIYDGNEKTPTVAVMGTDAASKTFTLTASDYTVSYANNKNATAADGTTASVTVTAKEGGNYTFIAETVNFEIRNGAAVLTKTPEAKDLTYDGTLQDLVNVGEATGGKVVYLLSKEDVDPEDKDSYSETIPQGKAAGTYTVYYMVKGDGNHDSTTPGQVSVTIKPRTITPIIALSGAGLTTGDDGTYSCEYDGSAKKPTVTVTGGVDANAIATTEYTVSYQDNTNAGTAKVIVSNKNGGNYIVNGTATFEITKKAPEFTAPVGKSDLKYNGAPQDLVKAGGSEHGTVVYSVNGGNWSAVVPTAMAVGDYTISYKVLGDLNHSDTNPTPLGTVTIAKNTVNNPAISLSSEQFTFNGSQQKPTVTAVYDDNGLLIPENEYSVEITGGNMVDVGTYTVTVTTPDSSNYEIATADGKNTRTFEIVPANQETISITGTKAQVRYGDAIQLDTTGGIGGSTVTWTVTDASGNEVNSEISATGLLTVKDVGGPIKVTVKRSAGGNYTEVSATWEFSAAKKQVTAVVTAEDRAYAAGDTSATVHVSVPDSELVEGDSITIEGVTGSFADPNVGTNKKVTVDSLNASASADSINAENYEITYPATTTASILAVAATVDTEPGNIEPSLTYDAGQAQELVTAGEVTGGIMVYSLDGANFTPSIPKAKDAGTYTVYFKAQGDGNHTDSEVKSVSATIGKQSVTPQIELSPTSAKYDGKEHKPTVTLMDGDNNVIPTSEYKVTYVADGGKNWTDKGDYTVRIENIDRGNYVVVTTEKPFTISTTAQNPLEITNKPGLVYYGDTFTLSAVGGSGSEKVTWSVDDSGKTVVEIDNNGFVKIIGTGPATITATKLGGDNYDTVTATYPLNALKKPVTAIVTADDKVYDNSDSATIHVSWKDGDLVGEDTIDTEALTGTFDDPNVGQKKTVTITGDPVSDTTSQKYVITIPRTTTASIFKADMAAPNVTANNRAYDGTSQPLVTNGSANTRYSDSRDGVYSENVPKGTNAGTYTVWYKELGDANHNDSAPTAKTVTISRKTLTNLNITLSGNDLQVGSQEDGSKNYSYVYDGTDKEPTVTIKDGDAVVPASEYTVSYSNNKNVSTDTVSAKVIITSNEGGNYTFDEQTVTFEITSASAYLTKSPEAKDLTYTGKEQELVTVGTATGGHIEYSLDGVNYSESIPKGETAGTYTVTYKVVGDGNYADCADTWTVSVTIKRKEVVSPIVTVTSGPYTYDGNAKELTVNDVKVEDGSTTIPVSEYTVSCTDNINAGTATVIITSAPNSNYIINATKTFTIGKADASVETAPTGNKNLPYNGTAQALLATAGKASGGTMVYSLSEDGEYSPVIPTGTAVDAYTVWYKVRGDGNHNDTVPESNSVDASIVVNEVENPTVQVTPEAVTYNGGKQAPTVTVKDGSLLIDGSEYTVTYADGDGNTVANPTNVGKYTLTIASKADSNYRFTATDSFEILPADQTPLTITGTRERVYYGDTIQLSTSGGSGSGTVTWDVGDSTAASIDSNGLLTITGVDSVKVTATSSAPGYADQTATWSFYAERKPVTAVVTAESRTYNGEKDATVTATLQSSDLVNGDEKVTITLAGSFEDPNAGANKKVTVDSTSPVFPEGKENIYANYNITYPATTTASIFKADIKAEDVTAPTAAENLAYTGIAQALVTPGSSSKGTLEYSTDGIVYSASLPTGTDADSYDVWYRVKGDSNHNDTEGTQLTAQVTITPQTVNTPKIEFSPTGASYDGAVHKPTVTVKDNNGRPIPDSEYSVDYGSTDWTKAGDHTVTVTDKDDGNYSFEEQTATFTIRPMGQSTLTITNKPGTVRYGDIFTLSAVGGSGTGTIKWEIAGPASITQGGQVRVTGSGSVTITATKQADGNYGESTDTWTFSAEKKPVKAIVTAKNKVYDTNDEAQLVITWKDGDLLGNDADAITLNLTGKFDSPDVGTNKTVTINGTAPASDKYEITFNTSTTASITPAAAKMTAPTLIENGLTYTGQQQTLVNKGAAEHGTILYSLDDVIYSQNVPKGTNAGEYTVWYKVTGDENYTDVAPAAVRVTIEPKTVTSPEIELSPEIFDYDGTAKKPDVVVKDGSIVIPVSEYTVGYSNNVQAGTDTAKVTINDVPGGNYTVSGSKNFTIRAGTAVLISAPEEKELTYTGSAQALVTKGTAVNGKVVYSLDDVDYSATIPKGTDAGTYEVYYKVVDNDGNDATEAESITVTIKPKQVTPTVIVTGSYTYTGQPVTPDVTVIVDGKVLTKLVDYYVTSNSVNPGPATATVISLGSNYQFAAVATFEITKAKATFLMEPGVKTDLVYTGEPQELVEFGLGQNGATVVYSLNGGTFYPFIPTGTEVGNYVVSAKVQGDDFYADSDVKSYRVTIGRNTIAEDKLGVTLSNNSLKYTGSELKPTVTVRDGEGNIITADEYSVSYKNNINVGQADVTVTSTTKNYSFSKTVHFTITDADAPGLKITGQPTDIVYYGDTLRLSTTGGSGTVTWSVESGEAESKGNGQFKIKSSGSITVKAETSDSSDTWTFYADPKPVKAIVTAASKTFDNSTTATLTVIVNSGLAPGDTAITTVTAEGQFMDANVGTDKTVIITKWTVPEEISKKYEISYDSTTIATITPALAEVTKEPEKNSGLTNYTGQPQTLVTPGEATGGKIKYSLDGEIYTYAVPTGTDAGSYTVWYKVVADDDNHKDSKVFEVDGPVEIAPNTTKPTVECKSATFTGAEQTPTVIVTVNNRTLPEEEYKVEVTGTPIAVGDYTVTVTDEPGGNYQFDTPVTATFKIVSADQNPLSIITDKSTVNYGDSFRLSAMGGSGSGAIHWSIKEENAPASISSSGVVTVTGTGGFTVEAYREAAGGYSDSNTDSVPFYANPKPITAVATAVSRGYNAQKDAAVTVTVPELNVTIPATGTFADENVGTGKTVTIVYAEGTKVTNPNYQITWPDTTTASIYKVDAQIENAPQPNPGTDNQGLTYKNDEAQPLLIGGTTVGGIGTIVYSTDQNGAYSTAIPTGTNAGKYTVWYKVADSVNYTGIPAAAVEVEIKKADPDIGTAPTATGTEGQKLSEIPLNGGATNTSGGKFAWKDGSIKPPVGESEQDVIFTPNDTANYNTRTFKVKVTVTASGGSSNPGGGEDAGASYTPPASKPSESGAVSAPMQTTVQEGTSKTVLNTASVNKLVEEAATTQSQNIVISPEIPSDVIKAEVSIPSSMVSGLSSETDAALTVSTPIADVTLPNEALSTLSSTSGTVDVVTERTEQGVALTVTAGGEDVENVPGGLTLTVPVEDAGPGTVAVLVHDDGTREIVQKSVVEDGVISIPLSGSATVEIVDNSKDFVDVPPESWEADAVDFASSHELFNGTSEATFSPDEPMSRGMLATVLYRLEGQPDQDQPVTFRDVDSDAWYAEGVAWAAENGIAGGYGEGQFGPDEDITREQFVVMLWRYAGSPAASGESLDFMDADQASDYALEALCWAVENGILNGHGDGQLDPGGATTRAQAAQMLKNFMENT